ncbi:MAG TPA: hypothetical protein VFW52_00870 [Candidatus Saccharimonadales bacterium]|nr:hypothetical protein [Candidatus Saccharimonadales bacterium]
MPEETALPPYLKRYMPKNQRFVACIRRHVIGLLYIYLVITAAAVALAAIAAAAVPDLLEGFRGEDFTFYSLVTFLLALLFVIILIIVTNIYRNNSIIITDQETVQVLQSGVFQVKVSNLSHADVEDVTAERNGLFATVFNYGNLLIETSGEMRNFAFKYCPDPDKYARIILDERQKFNQPPNNQ